jgi:PadR family transcriptional regulator PadR
MERIYTKQIQTKLTKGLLDLIVLSLLNGKPMHGYQIIIEVKKAFRVYFGPSTIYPLLNSLEEKGYVKSEWIMITGRPRKVYTLTTIGESLLRSTEETLNLICRKLGIVSPSTIQVLTT